jgi:hypothetical protein
MEQALPGVVVRVVRSTPSQSVTLVIFLPAQFVDSRAGGPAFGSKSLFRRTKPPGWPGGKFSARGRDARLMTEKEIQ